MVDARFVYSLIWDAQRALLLAMLCVSVVQGVLPAFFLTVTRILTDTVAQIVQHHGSSPANDFHRLLLSFSAQVGLGVLSAGLSHFQESASELVSDGIQSAVNMRVLRKTAALDVASLEQSETQDDIRYAQEEASGRPVAFLNQSVSMVQLLVTIGSVGSLLTHMGGSVLLLVLMSSLAGVALSYRYSYEQFQMAVHRSGEARQQSYLASLLISETVAREVRFFGTETYFIGEWKRLYDSYRRRLVDLTRRRGLASTLSTSVSLLVLAFATVSILRSVTAGRASVGEFTLFTLGIVQLQTYFSRLMNELAMITQTQLYLQRLLIFLRRDDGTTSRGEPWSGPIQSIEFVNVTFSYSPASEPVLQNVSFRLVRGQSLALVGENGAGKSTLLKLLTGLYAPTSGTILINGLDASLFLPSSLRLEMSVILQEYGRYFLPLAENIAMGDLGRVDSTGPLHEAATRAGLDVSARRFPQGMRTPLGKVFGGDVQLSGGQWQRVALARLHFREASVLILDEPTAALDAHAEHEMTRQLQGVAAEKITLIISHRLSTARLADRILVLDHGIITEQGTHAELLAAGRAYAELFRLQARGYEQTLALA